MREARRQETHGCQTVLHEDLRLTFAKCFQCLGAVNRIPNAALEAREVDLIFDQIVGSSGLHGFQIDFLFAISSQ